MGITLKKKEVKTMPREKGYKRPQAEIDKAGMIYSENLILSRNGLF